MFEGEQVEELIQKVQDFDVDQKVLGVEQDQRAFVEEGKVEAVGNALVRANYVEPARQNVDGPDGHAVVERVCALEQIFDKRSEQLGVEQHELRDLHDVVGVVPRCGRVQALDERLGEGKVAGY